MIRQSDGTLLFSPSDLVAFLEGDFAAWMERAAIERRSGQTIHPEATSLSEDPPDAEMEIIAKAGNEHEKRFLDQLRQAGRDVAEIDRKAPSQDTVAALSAGREVVYQARLEDLPFHGYPDFLFRVPGKSNLGDYHYEPWDTKLARSAKPYFLVQLSCYADLLERTQGVLPERLWFRLGDQSDLAFQTQKFLHYYRHLRRAFLEFQALFDPQSLPDPGLERSFGDWDNAAIQILVSRDHLRQTARITRGQIIRLNQAGITTLTQLATDSRASVSHLAPPVFSRLRTQARLQIASRDKVSPAWEVIPPTTDEPSRGLGALPPASPWDVCFDMEGFPLVEGGLEYLFGATTVDADGQSAFQDWWAHDEAEEKRAFETFVDWAWRRWRDHPDLHIYHYAQYEPAALRRLMGKYASREEQVDDLLRHNVLVDLYTVVRQGVLIGTAGYSLKDIEALYRSRRAGSVTTAGGSVVEYQRWMDSGEPRDWLQSPILAGIRSYNRDDCESTRQLAEWLRVCQRESGIVFTPPEKTDAPTADLKPPTPAEELATELLARAEALEDAEEKRLTQLVAWLVGFHRREAKPTWWRLFARRDSTDDELFEDADCLAGLTRTSAAPIAIKKSRGFEYRFDPKQDTRVRPGDKVFFAQSFPLGGEVVILDHDKGLVVVKLGPNKTPPEHCSLIPDEYVSADQIAEAVLRFAKRWSTGDLTRGQAVDDLLRRRAPRLTKGGGGDLVSEASELLPQVVGLVRSLDCTTLCIQGPPGTGKTWTAAHVIADLVRSGAKVGVMSNSHKAVLNLLAAVVDASDDAKSPARVVKAGETEDHPLIESERIGKCANNGVADVLTEGPAVVGGTAWVFCRPELEGVLDYLFVDEAGQVSLANLVGVGSSARNIVLVGDQMQLSQPTQGSHPGESGQSCLQYVLAGHPTVPSDRGVFLGQTRRMHPDVNGFISAAVYEGRLAVAAEARDRRIILHEPAKRLRQGTGIVVLEVPHEGNSQDSTEEAGVVNALLSELGGAQLVTDNGNRPLGLDRDVLVVAPYNAQVRLLKESVPAGVQVGTVDRFQGLEAAVVIVSMCSSSLEDAPRGASFLLSPNRLNVAISRAQCLAVVVASPALWRARCTTIHEMELMNFFCWLRAYSQERR